jgi:diphosphomevalonate decarboxylase
MTDDKKLFVTCSAPVNIAVIKYWGKRDEKLIIPLNSSISVTLHQKDLRTVTTIMASKNFKENKMWLNGKEEPIEGRLKQCLEVIQRRALDNETKKNPVERTSWHDYKLHICSVNNFPTAAGLASSAAGFACLVYAFAQLYGIQEEYPGELSTLARQGSGSACRSLYGGFVKWEVGTVESQGKDSIAVQLAEDTHWPLDIFICVVSEQQKATSSTHGMQRSVETSELLQYRVEKIVPRRITEMENAIRRRDFNTFAKITIRDSNQFHAICRDTEPPIVYMNSFSDAIVHVITKYNEYYNQKMQLQNTSTTGHYYKAAYTFDAGPNACIFTLPENSSEVLNLLKYYFSIASENDPNETIITKRYRKLMRCF